MLGKYVRFTRSLLMERHSRDGYCHKLIGHPEYSRLAKSECSWELFCELPSVVTDCVAEGALRGRQPVRAVAARCIAREFLKSLNRVKQGSGVAFCACVSVIYAAARMSQYTQ